MEEFEHLKIRLEELKKATDGFRSKVIGKGGFGKVYEGEVSHSKGRSMAAIKRLSREFGQGDPEFLKEIMMLSRYTHKNLISLLGFCDEDGEKILVYEHASNGSLDRHLGSSALTWTQRLKICLDVARGLAYLHDHKGTQQRILHRDIKSANILLDENWNAKLSDMGLSKLGPANQPYTVLFTNVVGTPGYCDPQYMFTYTLTKESDIYSFGVVLFEVLCGRLCFTYANSELQILVPMWKENYECKKLNEIIFKDLTPYMNPTSLETFSGIAFQCLHNSREQRPTTTVIVKKLETALRFQDHHDNMKQSDLKKLETALRIHDHHYDMKQIDDPFSDELIALLDEKEVFLNKNEKGESQSLPFDQDEFTKQPFAKEKRKLDFDLQNDDFSNDVESTAFTKEQKQEMAYDLQNDEFRNETVDRLHRERLKEWEKRLERSLRNLRGDEDQDDEDIYADHVARVVAVDNFAGFM